MDAKSVPPRPGGSLLTVNSYDGVELHGYLEYGGTDRLIIHFHGLAGNFYGNSFIHAFVRRVPSYGMSFLTANTRAHDGLAEAYVSGSGEVMECGAAHSLLHTTRFDVAAWIECAREMGFKSVVLQAHSAGAIVIADSLFNQPFSDFICGIVFLSPADMVGLQFAIHGEMGLNELLRNARLRVAKGIGLELLPSDVFPGYRFDSYAFLETFEPGGPGDIIDLRFPRRLGRLKELGRPILVLFGGGKEACPVPVLQAFSTIEIAVGSTMPLTCGLVADAPHSYRGHEDEVVMLVLEWCKKL